MTLKLYCRHRNGNSSSTTVKRPASVVMFTSFMIMNICISVQSITKSLVYGLTDDAKHSLGPHVLTDGKPVIWLITFPLPSCAPHVQFSAIAATLCTCSSPVHTFHACNSTWNHSYWCAVIIMQWHRTWFYTLAMPLRQCAVSNNCFFFVWPVNFCYLGLIT